MKSDPRGKPLSLRLSWPVAVLVYRNGLRNPGSPYLAFDEGDWWPNEATNIYLHRDAARAWQAFRDFLNGTADDWIRKLVIERNRNILEALGDD